METIPEACEESSSQAGDEDRDRDRLRSFGRRSEMEHSFCSSSCPRCKALGSFQFFKVYSGNSHLDFHKCSLASKSGYLSTIMKNSSRFKLPGDFPGGLEVFEAVIELCESKNGSSSSSRIKHQLLDPANVAIVHCAVEYLEMNIGPGNLCETTRFYLSQALASWSGAIQVLSSCYSGQPELLQLAEELLIVHQCIESLASMVCNQFDRKITTSSSSRSSSKKDLMRMPFRIFSRIIVSCSKQGLLAKNTGQIVVRYAEKWLFSECSNHPDDDEKHRSIDDELLHDMLDTISRLLPFERGAVPISFLFALLRYSIAIDAPGETHVQIESRIACQLDLATIDDLLMPFKSARQAPTLISEVDSMKNVVTLFMAQCRDTGLANWEPIANVARVWDEYLTEIGYTGSIHPLKFAELIDAVPGFVRVSHDQLYKAIHVFLKAHPGASQSERSAVCRPLDCQKLSQEVCIHAVQNELMPLRTIVQAMFVQQLHTRNAVDGKIQGKASTDRHRDIVELDQDREEILPFLAELRKERDDQGLKADLAATNNKLESLEQQLLAIRQALEESIQSERSGGVGRKISKAIQRVGLFSGLCKGDPQIIAAINPTDRCFPNRGIIHPEDHSLLLDQDPPRRSTSSRDGAFLSKSSTTRRHSRPSSSSRRRDQEP